ncbi:MAG: NOG1 family protein [Haloferacaceae archaeon]
MIFEDLPTTPRSEELVDKAFSRAARAGRAKSGREAQESMLRTAGNVLADNLENVVTAWPDLGTVDPFYRELADAVLRRTTDARRNEAGEEQVGVDALRASLSELTWASRQVRELRREYMSKIRTADAETARKHRKQAFARMADVLDEVEEDLRRVGAARDALRDLPDIRPDEPTIAVAGYPNVGKSSFVNRVTRARNEVASYPFTTKEVAVGHVERDRVRYQLVDTPGLLDRPPAERNDIERAAASAIAHVADAVLFLVDASEECGYPLDAQLELRDAIDEEFDVPVVTVCNKSDRSTDVEADAYMSVETGENVDAVLDAAVEAVSHEPDIPPSRRD